MSTFACEAEGEGFEPPGRLTAPNGFQDRRIRPLCHPSGLGPRSERRFGRRPARNYDLGAGGTDRKRPTPKLKSRVRLPIDRGTARTGLTAKGPGYPVSSPARGPLIEPSNIQTAEWQLPGE